MKAQHTQLVFLFRCAVVGLLVGMWCWFVVWFYLYCSDRAWWTGAPGALGPDWRALLAKKGIHSLFWEIPATGFLAGIAFGLLLQLFRVRFAVVWQALCFGCTAMVTNWYWMLITIAVPFSAWIAVFFTGKRQAYSAPATQFRPKWFFPGPLATLVCLTVGAIAHYWDSAFGDAANIIGLKLTPVAMFLVSVIASQICAGVWLEKCASFSEIGIVLRRVLRPAHLANAIVLWILVGLLAIIVFLPGVFAAIFVTFEAPQLDGNMRHFSITAPPAFSWSISLFEFIGAFGWLFIYAPASIFTSICSAKLFEQSSP